MRDIASMTPATAFRDAACDVTDDARLLSSPPLRRLRTPSSLARVTESAERLVGLVEKRWEELPKEVRHLLHAVAYETLRPVRPRIRDRIAFAAVVLRDGVEAVAAYTRAMQRLRDAVLSAIEREDPRYRQAVVEVLASAEDTKTQRGMTAGEMGAWIDSVLAQEV